MHHASSISCKQRTLDSGYLDLLVQYPKTMIDTGFSIKLRGSYSSRESWTVTNVVERCEENKLHCKDTYFGWTISTKFKTFNLPIILVNKLDDIILIFAGSTNLLKI